MRMTAATLSFPETVEDYIDLDLTHSIHTSERKSFKGCRRRWDWLFRQYYYPQTTAKPLEFGVAFHKAMEVLYEPKLWDKPRDAVLEMAIQAFRQRCIRQFDEFVRYFGEPEKDVVDDYNERMELGESMLRYHDKYVMDEFRSSYVPVKVEVSFEVPILNPDEPPGEQTQLWCKCQVCMKRLHEFKQKLTPEERRAIPHAWRERGLPVTYGGRIDCVMESLIDGRQWIFDWKTAAQLSEDRNTFLLLDDQISSYVWALWELGIDCAGFVYVEQRKADTSEPDPMKTIRLGRRFSTSKSGVTCGAEVYERVVSENDAEAYAAGLYDDFIQYLKENSKLSMAYTVHRNEAEILETRRDIANEAMDIIDPKLRIYKNSGRFSCGNCAFQTPCLEKSGGGDYVYSLESMFDKRKYHYWVDTEASTESKGGQ
jgi:hypothetical protein